ncbi:MAG: 3-dehydroquinate synthase [Cyclobacteriaceae bacterium]|nr:3-dehydroquinate synthase [Cyclobacteriaceae bacterium]
MSLPSHIIVTHDLRSAVQDVCSRKKYSQVAVLADENTLRHCAPLLHPHLPPHKLIRVPAGEDYKHLETCSLIWQGLTDMAFDRHGLLVILGGGVLGDMGGFCAATYKRGIDFVIVPTTLLAQVDASVGGKLAIDFNGFKNHIGVFQEPAATIIHTDFLRTLPARELRSGFAEIIKHCIISDAEKFAAIAGRALDDQDWDDLVRHSVAFKYSVTLRDPKESGLRKILNFGHTIGHALETWFLNNGNRIFHGEAVAAGMIAEAWLAQKHGLLTSTDLGAINRSILQVFGKIQIPADQAGVLQIMRQDKKNRDQKILVALPKGIGHAVWDIAVNEADVTEALGYYNSLQT